MDDEDWEPTPAMRMAAAERRIDGIRESRAGFLALTDLELDQFPASLGDLPDLRELRLGAYPLRRSALTSLAPLVKLQGLEILDLRNTAVTDITPLAQLR